MYTAALHLLGMGYRHVAKPILFRFNAELVHETTTSVGEMFAKNDLVRRMLARQFVTTNPALTQKLKGITFSSPFGLAAGFDYEAKLMHFLPSLGFGFGSVGTITNLPYEGNTRPRLGRLPKSQSLLVNKGFKNQGAKYVSQKLAGQIFDYPVGISIGATNSPTLTSHEMAIDDILKSFKTFEATDVANSYYELNISCPNVSHSFNFYSPNRLNALLGAIVSLRLDKPVFIKLPINQTDETFKQLIEVITKHRFAGIIVGNLQTNRADKSLDPDEVARSGAGNFSGKPTQKQSTHFVKLAHQHRPRLLIIGCGGVFTLEDALEKFKAGASLIQLITGLIYQGPQLVASLNNQLAGYLVQHDIKHLSELVR